MKPNLTADVQSYLERLTDYLTVYARQYPVLRFYSFLYENGQWMALPKAAAGEAVESYYERNLRKLLDYIEQHYSEDITEYCAAGIIGLSVSEFCRFFRKRMHCSFVAYKNKVRLRHAARMLLESECSCEQVGLDCGFSSYGYFKRVFEREYGVSPRGTRRAVSKVICPQITQIYTDF